MVNTINQSFSEVYDIINHFEEELYIKIPKGFINMLKQNRDKSYQVNIDYTKDINKQDLLKETRIILSIIYRDYLCSKEERTHLIEQDKKELNKYEQELTQKYDLDNIFKKRNQTVVLKQEEKTNEFAMVQYKESIFKKIINKIKNFMRQLGQYKD